jgi:hypothetical protein
MALSEIPVLDYTTLITETYTAAQNTELAATFVALRALIPDPVNPLDGTPATESASAATSPHFDSISPQAATLLLAEIDAFAARIAAL